MDKLLGAIHSGHPTFTGRCNAALTNNQVLRTTDSGEHWSNPMNSPRLATLRRGFAGSLPKVPDSTIAAPGR